MIKSKDFVAMLKHIARDHKTLYVTGCFGAPMNQKNKERYIGNSDYNRSRAKKINAAEPDTFGFDCVCLIKGILWGWHGDASLVYGGAVYKSNGVPDVGDITMAQSCPDLSGDFSAPPDPGEIVWTEGHIGVYVGCGLVVEATPAWQDKVQFTALGNIGHIPGYHTRVWDKHGHLPYVDYTDIPEPEPKETEYTVKQGDTLSEIARHYDTTIEKIADANGIWNPDLILVGQVLVIPGDNFPPGTGNEPKVGDRVRLAPDATVYGTDTRFSEWVYDTVLYVREIAGDRTVVSTQKEGAVTGSTEKRFLQKVPT